MQVRAWGSRGGPFASCNCPTIFFFQFVIPKRRLYSLCTRSSYLKLYVLIASLANTAANEA